jgi:hypothetical protein
MDAINAKVAWGMASYGPFPYAPVYTSHMRTMAYTSRHLTMAFADGSKIAGVGATDRVYTHSAENQLVRNFLDIPDATHLFLTEMDMILPDDTIVKLLELDKPIASGLYFLRNGFGQPCLYKKVFTIKDNPVPHTPISIFPISRPFCIDEYGGGCPGLGCVLIRREVFEAIEPPWFDLKEGFYGSDMYFYTKVRDQRIQVWVEPRVRCGHMDYVTWDFTDYLGRLATDRQFAANGYILQDGETNVR